MQSATAFGEIQRIGGASLYHFAPDAGSFTGFRKEQVQISSGFFMQSLIDLQGSVLHANFAAFVEELFPLFRSQSGNPFFKSFEPIRYIHIFEFSIMRGLFLFWGQERAIHARGGTLFDPFAILRRNGLCEPVPESCSAFGLPFCVSGNLPLFNPPGSGREVGPDSEELPGIGSERLGIALVFNLLQSLVRAGVHLQLHHVDVFFGLD